MPLRLSSLGRLVGTIVPRAQLVAIFDRGAQLGWASDTADHDELRTLAAELLAAAAAGGDHKYAMRCELDAAASYAFLMQDDSGMPVGVLALTIAGPFRRADLLRPAALHARLAPLLAEGARAEPESIERVLAVLADRLEADAVITCLPGEEFVRSHRRPGAQVPDDEVLQRLAAGGLAARTRAADAPLRVDRARIAPGAPVFGFVSVPLRIEGREDGGILAVFATQARRPFSALDAEQVAESGERLAGLLGRPEVPGASAEVDSEDVQKA